MFRFHGGCSGCKQQETHPTDFCMGCQYFAADWTLPNLNNRDKTDEEVERDRLLKKHSGPKPQQRWWGK